jgi:hypothetical protein
MATVLTRSNAEILRLTRAAWENTFDISAFLVDASGASPAPSASSSLTTWISYALVNPNSSLGLEPSVSLDPSKFSYDTTLNRAQTGELTFNFNSFITNEFDEFTSTTVTHVIFADLFGGGSQSVAVPLAVLQETTPLTLTSSSTLSYKLRLFGRAA